MVGLARELSLTATDHNYTDNFLPPVDEETLIPHCVECKLLITHPLFPNSRIRALINKYRE